MSTAAVSSTSIFQELQSFQQSRQSDLQQLGSALKSGNLNGAQQAYTTLAALGENGPFANSEPFSKSSRVQAFNALGEALQAGDLTRAQTAFAALSGSQSSSTTAPVTPIATPIATAPASIVNLGGTQAAASTTGSTSSIYQQIQAYQQQKQADLTQLGKDLTAGNASAAQQDFNTLTALGQSGPSAQGQVFQNSTRAQDFQAIGQALQAGNLAGAQSDFANLSATFGQSQTPPAAGPAPVVPPIAEAPNATGGIEEIVINLGSPSSTGSSSGSTTPEIVINLGQTSGSSSTSPEEITINLGGASSTSASSSTTPSSTSTTPEIVLNLGQPSGTSSGSPEEITINFGTGSAGAQITIGDNQGQNGNSGPQQTINLNPQGNYELILNLLSSNSATQTPSGSSSGLSVQA
jgi:hypothetical protein